MAKEIVVCSKCGTENPASAYSCSKCHGSLAGASSAPGPQRVMLEEKSNAIGQVFAVIGLVGILGASWYVIGTMGKVRDASREISAIQITQLYTQGSFWALVAIAVLLIGVLWVLSNR